MRIGGQEDRSKVGQEDRRTGQVLQFTVCLTHIPIDVHVLHPDVIVLQLTCFAVNVQIALRLNCIGAGASRKENP